MGLLERAVTREEEERQRELFASTGWRVFSDDAADSRCGLQTQAEVGGVFAAGLDLGVVTH
jgi:hypothetical protein